jgi:polyphosphate kinase
MTARTYEDFCLLTCDPVIGADISDLFNSLTGYSRLSAYRKLLVAPVSLRRGILERIEREIRLRREYGYGLLIFKLNALVDPEIIYKLYEASQAGVRVELIVRGICCLRPGLPGVSENIRVRSIVGRFLEHSRIFYFYNGGAEELFLGSADMMQRNLNNRVETLFPIEDPRLRQAIRERVLEVLLADTVNARELLPDGSYARLRAQPGEPPLDCQAWFLRHPLLEEDDSDEAGPTISALPSGA